MELPTIAKSAYASNSSSAADLMLGRAIGIAQPLGQQNNMDDWMRKQVVQQFIQPQPAQEHQVSIARIVKVFIADPNENLPLEKRVIYTGEEKLTDLTDQELFFEVPVAELLSKHNEYRKTVVDKKAAEKSGRDIFLDPVRIRDLRMVVVDVAKF